MLGLWSWFELLPLVQKGLFVIFCLWLTSFFFERKSYITYMARSKEAGTSMPQTFYFNVFFPNGFYLLFMILWDYMNYNLLELMRFILFSYGPTTVGHITGKFGMITCDPENIKAVLATSFKDFSLGDRYQMFFPLLGNGIFTLSGEGWKHSRQMLRPQFSRDQISHIESIKEHANLLIQRFTQASEQNKWIDAQVLFHNLTLDTASEFLFGESLGSLANASKRVQGPTRAVTGDEFGKAFGDAQETLAYRFMASDYYWMVDGFGFRRNADICKNFIDYFVHKALENPLEKDEVQDKYVFIRELTKETRDPVVIRDQAFNILLAGRDTTASTMSFMALYLSRNKSVWNKLRQAVLEDFGSDDTTITFESLKRCKYLNNVINEVLRLHPIVPVNFRHSIVDTKLPRGGGPDGDLPVFVPKGTLVFYSTFVMHRNPKYWGPKADEFDPDRWDDIGAHNWDFLPFNGGPRICLGQQFALTEIGIVWVRLCQAFKDIDDNNPVKNLRTMKQHVRLTVSVAGGVPSKWHPVDD